jgi:dUTP pyrophosphatase
MTNIRGFEVVSEKFRKFPNEIINLPKRSTAKSAGYDFFSNEAIEIQVGEQHLFFTDVKAYMLEDEVLKIYVRSSIAIKKNLQLKNLVGIIDSDYYSNVDNDGQIIICLKNTTTIPVKIDKHERIAQGIFTKYLKADNDEQDTIRIGGVGSTSK